MISRRQITHLNIGLEDTLSYYEPAAFAAGFKKTMVLLPCLRGPSVPVRGSGAP